MEKKAKGSLLIDYARMIRSFKNLAWDQYLKPEDWETINSIILPSQWYPFDLYYRCSLAAYKLLAQGKLENAKAYGRSMAKNLLETTYQSIANKKEPDKGLRQFVTTYRSLFNFGVLTFDEIDAKHCRIHLDYNVDNEGSIAYCYQLQGMLETVIEATGGKNGNVVISDKQWLGAPKTTYDINWE